MIFSPKFYVMNKLKCKSVYMKKKMVAFIFFKKIQLNKRVYI